MADEIPQPAAEQPSVPAGAVPAPRAPSRAERRAKWWAETKVDLKWAVALLFVLVLAMSGYFWNDWREPVTGTEDLSNVTDAFFSQGDYVDGEAPRGRAGDAFGQPGLVVPFEILSVLLLAALIAGVVIALREKEGDA